MLPKTLNKDSFPAEKHPLICAINIIGGQSKLAKILGISRQNIDHWLHHRKLCPPEKYCEQIEKLTNSVVTKQELRPDIFKDIPNKNISNKVLKQQDMEKAKSHIKAALNYMNSL